MSLLLTTPAEAGAQSRPGRCWAPAFAGVVASVLGGCAMQPRVEQMMPPSTPTVVTSLPAPSQAIAAPFQYLYGSGEAAAASEQAWHALVAHTAAVAKARPTDSVVLTEEATLAAPRFEPCGAKPFAAVFDVDETVLLNLGFESDDAGHPGRAYSEERWQAWERSGADRVVATPGAAAALAALRAMRVTVVFNTNRSAVNAAETQAAIEGAGLGPAVHKQTLWLKGDDNTGSLKDVRRGWIADRFCVIAMGGDQLGDFSDLFNERLAPGARRAAATAPAIARLWGKGWFVLPNPVYGTALRGGVDDVFPTDKRWSPPAAQEK